MAITKVTKDIISDTLDLSGKTVTLPSASVTSHVTAYDDDGLQNDIALLGFRVASNGSLAKYNLVDQTIDDFQDASGIDAGSSTNDNRDSTGKYYSGSVDATKEFAATNSSWAIPTGALVTKLIVIGGGGAGGTNLNTGTNGYGSGAGGGAWAGAVNYTVGAGITSANVTIGAGGATTTTTGNAGGTTSIVFGSDFTLTAAGGGGGVEEGAAGAGGTASKSGTSSASTTTLLLAGGAGGAGIAGQPGSAGSNGNTGTLDSVTYTSSGGGGGGAGGGGGGVGGNGLSSSYSGGGGGGGSDSVPSSPSGGSGYGTAGVGSVYDGTQNAGSVTIDSVTVSGGTGGDNTTANGRPYTNAGGGGMCGGGGGGGGDGGLTGAGHNGGDGGQGYVKVDYVVNGNMTLVSTTTTAQAAPTKGDIVFTYTNGAGTTTLGTDLTAEFSADGGSTWTSMTLGSEGTTGSHNIATAHDVTLTSTSGTSMAYRIKTLNQSVSKTTRIQAVSLGWS
jgi:hypothetical protein